MLSARRLLSRLLPGPLHAIARDFYYAFRRWNADRQPPPAEDSFDRALIPPQDAEGRAPEATGRSVQLLVAMTLQQDLDILLPVITAAQERHEIALTVAVPHALLKDSPRLYRALLAARIVPRAMTEKEILAGTLWVDAAYDALLTAAESDLPAHRLGHALAKQGRARGARTYTVQHGYENVGLTYFDRAHGAEVRLASGTVFTWQNLRRLQVPTPPATLRRCVAVGCPKPIGSAAAALPMPAARGPLVAVFENLHWHRYSDRYRNRFLSDLRASARALPDWRFLVKPHHAGRWLAEQREGRSAEAENLLIVDPIDPAWEPFTAPALIAHVDAVVSTPSTVALDAARAGKPVAVAGYDLDLPLYEPLPILRSGEDWRRFLRESDRAQLAELGRRFVERAIIPGDGAVRLLDHIAADVLGRRPRATAG